MLGFKKIKKVILPFVTAAMLLPAAAGIVKAETKPAVKQTAKQQIAAEVTEKREREEPSPSKSFLSRLEFELGYTNALYLKNPLGDYFKQLNKDFRTGRYTFTTPIADANGKNLWKDIKTPKSSPDFGMEISCLYKLGKNEDSRLWILMHDVTDLPGVKKSKGRNLRVGPVLGFRISSPTSTYNKSYDIWDEKYQGGKYIPTNFKRQENIRISTFSIGARGKASLTKKLDASATLGINFYKVKGDVKLILDRLDNKYVQWREVDYKGKGTGLSVEAGVNYKFRKNIWIGAALGYRTGKVQTKGKQMITTTSNPGNLYIRDYSPEFDPSGAYGKFIFGIRF